MALRSAQLAQYITLQEVHCAKVKSPQVSAHMVHFCLAFSLKAKISSLEHA
jgi:hypothetical protein